MSLIKTDAIQTLAGKPIVNSTGSVLQVVQALLALQLLLVSKVALPRTNKQVVLLELPLKRKMASEE